MTARDDAERLLRDAEAAERGDWQSTHDAALAQGNALLAIADAIEAAADKIVAARDADGLGPHAYEAAVQVVAKSCGWSPDSVRTSPREALHSAELHAIGKPDNVRDGIVEARVTFARLGML